MKKYKKLTALVLAAAMIFAVCSCKASSPKAVIVKTVENEFDFPVYDKSDEEIADYIYKVTTGFRVGMTVEKWKNLIGFIPEFDEQEGNARSFEYGYGARMGTWPLKDNIQKIALYGYDNVGFHMGSDCVTVDYNGELNDEQVLKVEQLANRAVCENRSILIEYPEPERLEEIPYRSKLDLKDDVRIVTIEGYDICTCCASLHKAGVHGMGCGRGDIDGTAAEHIHNLPFQASIFFSNRTRLTSGIPLNTVGTTAISS